ncbi:cephalosporin c regulator 1 [Fusarium sporotrichioides]|uniref:Cephalosporin c regulator 1 n=1 Tax=Fusarium sporotrichioides TaxID=5514 RepID=A0A395RYH2_FUSSP|nr:cephalosporin c regulator 1 [Fusarium sporotrichioides]
MYSGQWLPSEHAHIAHAHGHVKDMSGTQMSPDEMLMQAATHIQGGQDFSMDASMGAPMGHHLQYQQRHPSQRHPLPAEQYSNNASFTEGESQLMERDENDEGDSRMVMGGAPKTTSTRSSANNEHEMRQLYHTNKHRGLDDVARELHGNDRGPNSERTRQVFAMLWINSVCKAGKGSVPRGRVYANYASKCANERITVLNPASFGKLVRVLFPGLKTRRLGVRGESKYHYVNFQLQEESPEVHEAPAQIARPQTEARSLTPNFNQLPAPSNISLSQGTLPSPHIGTDAKPDANSRQFAFPSHSLYNEHEIRNLESLKSTAKTQLELAFPPETEEAFTLADPLPIPLIDRFLPQGTDPDAAMSLSALYRSHCTSLVECIRYCKEKNFFHLYTSFLGTLTTPVLKLLANPALAPWIEECDFVLYQRMMRIVSSLTLQVVPKPILDTFRTISDRLVPHIREAFQGQPQHVIRAKEAPATLFAGLLDRALRVNLTAHAAANMLSPQENRNQMFSDWVTMIRVRKIAECVPTRGMDDVVQILLRDIRSLLDNPQVPWEVETLTVYGEIGAGNSRSSENDNTSASVQNVLDSWVEFLRGLPRRFPYASPTEIVWCIERIGTAVMRDITLGGGKSFGSWWVTKTWLDEMACFLAETGGFMKQKGSRTTGTNTASPPPQSAKDTSRQTSRYSSGSDELNLNNASQNQGERAPFPPASNKVNQNSASMNGGDMHDDSGIGIRTPEEEFNLDKFDYTGAENQEHDMLTGSEFATGGL